MTYAATLARCDAFTEALRLANDAIGNDPPTDQALRIIKSLQRARDDKPARVTSLDRVDYLGQVQQAARTRWSVTYEGSAHGPGFEVSEKVQTPLGLLTATVWRRCWTGPHRGKRTAWAAEYHLNGKPISITEIREAGLAMRPTERAKRARKNA